MGGHGGGGSAPQNNDAAMMQMIKQQQQAQAAMQAAVLQAQRDAAAQAQATGAQSQATAGNQAARQYLDQQTQVQQAKDLAAAQAASQAAAAGGNAAAGGFNLGEAKQQAASTLGASPGTIPTMPTGTKAPDLSATRTPSVPTTSSSGAGSNQFMPLMQGITFGGS